MNTITPQAVTEWSKEPDSPNLEKVCAAVNAYVNSLPVVQLANGEWSDSVRLGAIMLAAKLIKRRNTPNGVEAATEAGVIHVARYDSDISRLLALDSWNIPQVG